MNNRGPIYFYRASSLIHRLLVMIIALTFLNAGGRLIAVPQDLIQQLGFSALDSAPIDFELKDMAGTKRRLSDYKGKWIWLVFWATWCGACDAGMPSLESLYQEFKGSGLSVVAVTIDQGPPDTIKNYIENKNLTYTVLHDEAGDVAGKYQAQSIPTTYLISPDWKAAGVIRGAVDWERQKTLDRVRELIAHKSLPTAVAGGDSVTTKTESVLSLPEKLIPPKIKIAERRLQLVVGKWAKLDVTIEWQGDSHKYLIKVPKLTLPDNVELGKISSSSQGSHEDAKLVYHFPIKINSAGVYHLGPIELAYEPRSGGAMQYTRVSVPSVEVKRPVLNWKSPGIVLSLLALIILLIILTSYAYRKMKPNDIVSIRTSKDEIRTELDNLRRLRLSGDKTKYSIGLLELYIRVREEFGVDDSEKGNLKDFLERIKYAGTQVTEIQLKSYEKKLDKILEDT